MIKIVKLEGAAFQEAENRLCLEGLDYDVLLEFNNREPNFYGIHDGDILCGLAQVSPGDTAFMYIFVDERYRNMGVGHAALKLCEPFLLGGERKPKQIMSVYDAEESLVKKFAAENGFNRKFNSVLMKYNKRPFADFPVNARQYEDGDYREAQAFYGTAFHEMRLSTGDFPESTKEQPSEEQRKHWCETAKDRFVCIYEGQLAGYAHIDGSELSSVCVKTELQGKGIGRNFVKYLCNEILSRGCGEICLYCVVGNKARSLYDSLGFREEKTMEFAVKNI